MACNDFNGQIALVTGGGSGIGRATCLKLAERGARVVATDLNKEGACDTLSLMANPKDHLALYMDVTKKSDVEAVIAACRNKYGKPPNLLLNSAGVIRRSAFASETEAMLDKVMNVNLKGTFLVTQVFLNALVEGSQRAEEGKGAVVNIASMAGKSARSHMSIYAPSKGAVISFTKSCAAEYAKQGIRVNCVLPGMVVSPMSRDGLGAEYMKDYCDNNPLGRGGKPEEVAEVVLFLLSRRSSYMVGACVEISGGTGM